MNTGRPAARPRKRARAASRGFTLIEILTVLALVAILATLAFPRFANSLDSGRERVRAQNMATLRDALDKFRADQGRYPLEWAELVQKQYLRAIPLDPVSGSAAWVAVPEPTGEPGIYDVASPVAAEASAAPSAAREP
jgi:general secretion pathway protein G